ncbi:MAG: hypothetical protein ACI4C3_00350 [Bacteroides sp.]
MKLTSVNVNAVFEKCLGTEADLKVRGMKLNVCFNREKIEFFKDDIKDMLLQLPKKFMQSEQKGWSSLNACMNRNGNQWTGSHQDVDALVCLGIAAGLADFLLPRDWWYLFPDGMPYFVVLDNLNK